MMSIQYVLLQTAFKIYYVRIHLKAQKLKYNKYLIIKPDSKLHTMYTIEQQLGD